jgi:hypothetical protein
MADAGDSKSPALHGHEGSTPSSGTKNSVRSEGSYLLLFTHKGRGRGGQDTEPDEASRSREFEPRVGKS